MQTNFPISPLNPNLSNRQYKKVNPNGIDLIFYLVTKLFACLIILTATATSHRSKRSAYSYQWVVTCTERAVGIEKAFSNLLKSVFLLHLCLCGHNVDDFLSTFITPYFHTYVNGYHQIKEPKVKRIERGLRPARLYYFVKLVFLTVSFRREHPCEQR